MVAISANIKYLRTEAGLSQEELGKLLGLNRDNIASYERGAEPKIGILVRIATHFKVSIDDLVNKELPLNTDTKPANYPVPKLDNPTLEEPFTPFLFIQKDGVPLVGAEAIAGLANHKFSIEEKDIQERYVVPDFENIDFMIRVKGSSMYPKYNSGDVVACRILKERTFIQWNKVHVIATKEQGILIKRLRKGPDKDLVTAVSDNKDYDPFDIPWNEITSIALVVGVIRLE